MASSHYFNAMLSSGMRESITKEIQLHDINGGTLRILIDFCYSGKIKIDEGNIENILSAASRYEFVEIEKQCSVFLKQTLKNEPLKCLTHYSTANLYNLNDLKELCKQFSYEHFMLFKDSEEFLSLEFDQLIDMIKSDDLNVPREEDVFTAIMKWIKHDRTGREKFLVELCKNIRFAQVETTVSLCRM